MKNTRTGEIYLLIIVDVCVTAEFRENQDKREIDNAINRICSIFFFQISIHPSQLIATLEIFLYQHSCVLGIFEEVDCEFYA